MALAVVYIFVSGPSMVAALAAVATVAEMARPEGAGVALVEGCQAAHHAVTQIPAVSPGGCPDDIGVIALAPANT